MKVFKRMLHFSMRTKDRALFRCYRILAKIICWKAGGDLKWHRTARATVPVRIDGCGRVTIGAQVKLGYRPAPRLGRGEILLQARRPEANIDIGSRTAASNNVSIVAMRSVSIGTDCLLGDLVAIYDCDFHAVDARNRRKSPGKIEPVRIGNNVWLGSRVIVLKGVTIGSDTVVAAGSVVTQTLPSGVVAGGVPAKVLKPVPVSNDQ